MQYVSNSYSLKLPLIRDFYYVFSMLVVRFARVVLARSLTEFEELRRVLLCGFLFFRRGGLLLTFLLFAKLTNH
jgi:hypothetical protein